MVHLGHPYMTTGKTIALSIQNFVGKIISLLFNTLSRFVITFLSRSKHLLISRLQSTSAVILEPPKIKLLEKEMAAYSSVLAWRIPGTGSLVGSMGSHRVGHD